MKRLLFFFFAICIPIFPLLGQSDQNSTNGSFTDSRDSHVYKTVQIGTQVWMAENLAFLPKVSPAMDHGGAGDKDYSIYYVYDYDFQDFVKPTTDVKGAKSSEKFIKYGVLYNWAAANSSCPSGWHLPNDKEWQQLEQYLGLGNDEINNMAKWRESGEVGAKLKSVSGWGAEGKGTDKVGFKALPGGIYWPMSSPMFDKLGEEAQFWTASDAGAQQRAGMRKLSLDNNGIFRGMSQYFTGMSVRCIKNN